MQTTSDLFFDDNKEILFMTIDLPNGKSDYIKIREKDNPFELAKAFCNKHNL